MAGDLFHRIGQNKVKLWIYFIEKAELRYGQGFIQEKRPKQETAWDLFH